jgi:predicted transcriptional regulator
MDAAKIRQRAQAIRLSVKELARLSGVSEDNLHRVLNGTVDPRVSTFEKVQTALTAEEDRLRQQLGGKGEAA